MGKKKKKKKKGRQKEKNNTRTSFSENTFGLTAQDLGRVLWKAYYQDLGVQ